mgnify:CR=1 FL=1
MCGVCCDVFVFKRETVFYFSAGLVGLGMCLSDGVKAPETWAYPSGFFFFGGGGGGVVFLCVVGGGGGERGGGGGGVVMGWRVLRFWGPEAARYGAGRVF